MFVWPLGVVCVILILVAILFILLSYKKQTSTGLFDLGLIIICTSVVLLHQYRITNLKNMSNENFVDPITEKDENLAYIAGGLTLYYSAFSDTSYNPKSGNQGDLKKWYNISTHFKEQDKNTCAVMRYTESHMGFYSSPTFSHNDGMMLGNNYITGPMSYTLGFAGNTQYSIFMFVKFMSIASSTRDIELFQIFGNTSILNGIRLYMSGNNTDNVSKDISGCNLYLEIGNGNVLQCQKEGNRNIMFQHNKPYLFIMTNNNSSIKLSMYEGLKENKIDLINAPVTSHMFDISLSNKNMLINQYQNVNGNIYAFGVYNKVLADNDMINLQTHLFSQIQVMDPGVIERNKVIETLKQDISQMKACPYDLPTCEACKSVTDWTNVNAIMTTRDTGCLEAIDRYCTENPSHAMCKCWNSNDNAYTTTQCMNYRNIYTNKSCVDIDNMDRIELSKVKSKYNMCNCTEEVVSLQPLRMPEISKFKIDTDLLAKAGNASCADGTSTQVSTVQSEYHQNGLESTTVNNKTAQFSGYNGDMSQDIINFFQTVQNSKQNNAGLATQNATRAKAAIKRPIPDYFADINVKNRAVGGSREAPLPTDDKSAGLVSFWSSF